MAQPYSTTAQVLNRVLATLAGQATWNRSEPGFAAIQDLTYTQLAVLQTPVTVAYVAGVLAGSEAVTVSGNAIVVKIQSGASTATQVLAAINASAAALALLTAAITGTGSNPQTVTAAPTIITGDVVQRISEADREIDSRLAGLEIPLPFAVNPPLLQDLSVLWARYACFRDLYAAGDPTAANPQADHYLSEFEKKWMNLEEGWAKIVDGSGANVAMSKFATLTAAYPCAAGAGVDAYPNYPDGPYADPPGIGS